MKAPVMGFIRRLMAQQIPLRPGIKPALINLPRMFPHRQSNGAVRMRFFYRLHQHGNLIRHISHILPALQHKSSISQFIPSPAACKNLFRRQPVSSDLTVRCTDAAVITVVFTKIRKLDQPPDIDIFPVILLPEPSCPPEQLPGKRFIPASQQRYKFRAGKNLFPLQFFQ